MRARGVAALAVAGLAVLSAPMRGQAAPLGAACVLHAGPVACVDGRFQVVSWTNDLGAIRVLGWEIRQGASSGPVRESRATLSRGDGMLLDVAEWQGEAFQPPQHRWLAPHWFDLEARQSLVLQYGCSGSDSPLSAGHARVIIWYTVWRP